MSLTDHGILSPKQEKVGWGVASGSKSDMEKDTISVRVVSMNVCVCVVYKMESATRK